jgi:hypothetical protein
MAWDKIAQLKELLADIRIKHGVDYVILHKYKVTRVMCDEVWYDSIQEVAESIGLQIHDWHFYSYLDKENNDNSV